MNRIEEALERANTELEKLGDIEAYFHHNTLPGRHLHKITKQMMDGLEANVGEHGDKYFLLKNFYPEEESIPCYNEDGEATMEYRNSRDLLVPVARYGTQAHPVVSDDGWPLEISAMELMRQLAALESIRFIQACKAAVIFSGLSEAFPRKRLHWSGLAKILDEVHDPATIVAGRNLAHDICMLPTGRTFVQAGRYDISRDAFDTIDIGFTVCPNEDVLKANTGWIFSRADRLGAYFSGEVKALMNTKRDGIYLQHEAGIALGSIDGVARIYSVPVE